MENDEKRVVREGEVERVTLELNTLRIRPHKGQAYSVETMVEGTWKPIGIPHIKRLQVTFDYTDGMKPAHVLIESVDLASRRSK